MSATHSALGTMLAVIALVAAACATPADEDADAAAATAPATPGEREEPDDEREEPPRWPWELAAAGEEVPVSVPLDDIRPRGGRRAPARDVLPAVRRWPTVIDARQRRGAGAAVGA